MDLWQRIKFTGLVILFNKTLYSQNTCTVAANLNPAVSICSGQSTTLNVTGTPSGVTYQWSANAGNATTPSVTVNPTTTTTYTVTITQAGTANKVINGDFESGNTGFSTAYNYIPCGNSSTVIANGEYGIGISNYQCYSYWGTLPAQQGTRFMYVDALPPALVGTTPARSLIWEQNVSVEPNTCYTFSSWQRFAVNIAGQDRIPKVEYFVDNNSIGQSQYVTNSWVQTVYSAITGPSQTSVNLKIYAITELDGAGNITDGNDLAIDNIEFKIPDQTSVRQVTVTVNTPPSVSTTVDNASVCLGGTATLSATNDASYSYQWQQSSDNTNFVNISGANASTYATLGNSMGTTYYRVRVTQTGNVCPVVSSNSASVTVVADPIVSLSIPPSVVCVGANITLTATPTVSIGTCAIQWQSSPNGVTWSNISGATSNTYNIVNLNATTRYRAQLVSCTGSGCCN
jgi:hypothetical protein